jgi:hypothetical protein
VTDALMSGQLSTQTALLQMEVCVLPVRCCLECQCSYPPALQ